MTFPKNIIKVRPLGGIVNDLPAHEVAPQYYTNGENMHFRQSFAERTQGHAKVYRLDNTGIDGDGTNHLEVSSQSEHNFGSSDDFTVELWFRYAGTAATRGLICKCPSGGAGYGILHKSDGKIEFFITDGTNLVTLTPSSTTITDQNWHHLAMTINQANNELNGYVDGTISGNSPASITAVGSLSNGFALLIHREEGETAFNGAIDDVRIWNDVRSASEISANKDTEVSGSAANLVGYWKMNGTIGASVTTVEDETSNNNDLTDTGAGDMTYVDSLGAFGGLITTLRNISNCQVAGTNYWLYHGTDKSTVVTGSTHSNITKSGGITGSTTANVITSGLLNGVHFMNNGIDAPLFWDGVPANLMTNLTGWPASTTCKAMRAFKFHLFAMDISKAAGEFPMQVLWSSAAAPGTIPSSWTAAATNEAGDAELSQTPGQIIDGLPLRSSFMFYKTHSAYIADYVGGNNIFNFRQAAITSGVLTRNCIASYKGRHFVVTDGDVILTDGSATESLVDNRMRKFLFNQLDQDNYESTFVVTYPKQNEIWICFPSAGSTFCDLAMIWDGAANAWGVRDIPDITHAAVGIVSDETVSEFWDDDSQVWDLDTTTWNQQNFSSADDRLVLAKPDDSTPADSVFLQVDSSLKFNGTNISASISKHSMTFDDPNRVKFLRRIIPHIQALDGTEIKIRAGSQMVNNEAIAWSNEVTFTVGTDKHVDTFAQGKFLSFEFRSDGEKKWTMTGFDIEAELRGYH